MQASSSEQIYQLIGHECGNEILSLKSGEKSKGEQRIVAIKADTMTPQSIPPLIAEIILVSKVSVNT